jgi:hypothetical protein
MFTALVHNFLALNTTEKVLVGAFVLLMAGLIVINVVVVIRREIKSTRELQEQQDRAWKKEL